MSKLPTGASRLLACAAAALLLAPQLTLAHLTRNECIQGSGCIAGRNNGLANFEFSATTTANPPLHSGTLRYTDSSGGIDITSSTLLEYGDGSTPSERMLSYQINAGAYREARVFVSDSGPTASDSFRIQLLDASSTPIYENSGALRAECPGGITVAASCLPPVPCEIEVSVQCAVVRVPTNAPSSSECTFASGSADVDFFYTIKNSGTAAIQLSALGATDSFGALDLSSLGTGLLQPGAGVTLVVRETVTGPFPFVNTVTVVATNDTTVCRDLATVTIRQQTTQPPGNEPPGNQPPKECPDFVTGGGWIVGTPTGGKANFGVHGGMKNGLWGGLNYIDHKAKMHVKSTAITGYSTLSAVGRQLTFNVTIDGTNGTAIVKVFDNGEPGRDDRFEIQLSGGYSAAGDLGGPRPGGGNIQLHIKCKDKDDGKKPRDDDDDDKDKGKDGDKDDDDDDDKGKGKDRDRDDDDDDDDDDRDKGDKGKSGKGKGGDDDDDDKKKCPHASKCRTDRECESRSKFESYQKGSKGGGRK
jgi:hypothetical protein